MQYRSEESIGLLEQNRLFQMERTYDSHQVQLPEQFRADQKLKHVVKYIVQMLLKH